MEATEKFSRGWGHLITWNGPIMGHLNNFSASGGGTFPKIFQKFKCPGGCPGFDWYIISDFLERNPLLLSEALIGFWALSVSMKNSDINF